ncbi:Rib/alpha-like domain-containing protein [Streptococcus merionis]|uniref:Rib/alpha-like domain-containing protein n=1 Tax=Streptococcus merionis TaxID=400065 RepID=UPI003518F5AA
MRNNKRKKFDWYGLSQRFSIRKYHFGAASVLLGTAMMLGVTPNVSAEENSPVPTAVEEVDPNASVLTTEEAGQGTTVAAAVEATPTVTDTAVVDLSAVKDSALNTLKELTALTEAEKAVFVKDIEGATTQDTVNEIVNLAKTANETAKVAAELKAQEDRKAELTAQKASASETVGAYNYLSTKSREDYLSRIQAATTTEEVEGIVSQAQEHNAKRKETFPEQGQPIPEGVSFRKVSTDVYTDVAQQIKALEHLTDTEKQYYTAELTKLTKGVINRDNKAKELLETAKKHNDLVSKNRGTSETDAIENTVAPNSKSSVSGIVTHKYGGSINANSEPYTKPLKGVKIFAQWYEKNGFASPIYTTVSNEDGTFGIGMADFIGADGKLYQFNAAAALPAGEKWRVWSINPDTDKYTLLYSFGDEQISPEGIVKDLTAGADQDTASGKLTGVKIVYANKTSDVWRQDAKDTEALADGGYVKGSIYWNNNSPAGNQVTTDIASRESKYDLPIANVDVYASYLTDYAVEQLNSADVLAKFVDASSEWQPKVNKDKSSNIRADKWTAANEEKLRQYILEQVKADRAKWVAETVKTKTNEKGEYELQFNGTFGFKWNNPGFTGKIIGVSPLLNEGEITNAETGVTKKGTEWMGELAPSATYGSWTTDGRAGKSDLNNAPKHINTDWVIVTPADMEGISFYNAFYGDVPKGGTGVTNGWYLQGAATRWDTVIHDGDTLGLNNDTVTNVYFAAVNDNLVFDIYNHDSFHNYAKPGETAKAKTAGLMVGTGEKYKVIWKDADGKVVKESEPLTVQPDGTLPEQDFTVPAELTTTTQYVAELYALGENDVLPSYPMQKDSFIAVYKELPKYEDTTANVGDKNVKSQAPTFDVEHTTEVETKPAPKGAKFALVSKDGDETVAGFSIDANTGVITWAEATEDTEVEVEVTYEDGTTATTTAKFFINKPDNDKYTPSYQDVTAKAGTTATTKEPVFTDVNGEEVTPTDVKYELGEKAPEGAKVDPATGVVSLPIPAGTASGTEYTVPVKVTYKDGTSDDTSVKVTVAKSDTDTYYAEGGKISKELGEPTTNDDLKAAIKFTTQTEDAPEAETEAPEGTKVEPKAGTELPDGKTPGVYRVPVVVTYPDETTDETTVTVIVGNVIPVEDADSEVPEGFVRVTFTTDEQFGTFKEGATTVFDVKKGTPKAELEAVAPTATPKESFLFNSWAPIMPDTITEKATYNAYYKVKDSVIYEPAFAPITKPYGQATTEDDVKGAISFTKGEGEKVDTPKGTEIAVKEGTELPDGNTPGTYDVPVTITYEDGTTDEGVVKVTVLDKVIDRTQDPSQPTPDGYVRVTFTAGENGQFAEGTSTVFDVLKDTAKSDVTVPTVVANEGYVQKEGAEAWSPALPETFTATGSYEAQYKEATTYADKIEPAVPEKTTVADKTNLTDEEKATVKQKVEDANKDKFPENTQVEIGNDGTATIKYPDQSEDKIPGTDLVEEKAADDADKYTPTYADKSGKPGEAITTDAPTFAPELPADQKPTYAISDKQPDGTTALPEGTVATVDKDGKVSVTIPTTATPKTEYTIPVEVTYGDGSKEIVPVKVTVTSPEFSELYTPTYSEKPATPGEKATSDAPVFTSDENNTVIDKPAGTQFELGKGAPEGATVDQFSGVVTVPVPADAAPGTTITVPVVVKYVDGSTDETTVTFKVPTPEKDTTKPTVDPIEDQTVVEGNVIAPITVKATDDSGKAPTVEVTGLPEGVTYDSATGVISGTPTVSDWGQDEEKTFTVTVKVTDEAGNETVETFEIKVQRDTDNDGTPDITDEDDDNDGFTDEQEKAAKTDPKDPDSKPTTTVGDIKDQTFVEGQPIAPIDVPIENKPDGATVEVEGLPDGVTYDSKTGQITGQPTVKKTDWGDKEELDYPVKVTVKDKDGNVIAEKEFTVTVQRDTDGDTVPDIKDEDDDNDGFTDKQEEAAKTDPKDPNSKPDGLSATTVSPTVTEKTPVPANTKVVTPSKEGSTITGPESPVAGLTVDADGNLTGTPTVTDWAKDEETRVITIPVTVKNGDEEITVTVTVTVQRDTDGDKVPDITDEDDDNDGFTDKQEKDAGTDPKDPNDKPAPDKDTTKPTVDSIDDQTVVEGAPIAPITVKATDDSGKVTVEVTGLPDGVTYDSATGVISGTPTVKDWGQDEEKTITVTVTATDEAGNQTVETFEIKVQRDTDGDKDPDVTDPDDDNDGFTDEQEKAAKTDPKDPNSKPTTTVGDIKDQTFVENQPITPIDVPVTNVPDKGTVEVTDLPEGVTYDSKTGQISGEPTVKDWGQDEETRDFTVTVIVKDKDGKVVTEKGFKVTVQRDTDGDKDPDVTDPDDDNDGFTDEQEKAAKTDPKDPNSKPRTSGKTDKPKDDKGKDADSKDSGNKPQAPAKTDKSKADGKQTSAAALPKTGTEVSNAGAYGLAALGLAGGLLVLGKRKKEEED